MIDVVLFILAIAALFFGSITDIKKREVPDWISHGLIYSALGVRLIYAIFFKDYAQFFTGVLGFAACFALAVLLFYTKQWGGGDAKILMGIGAVLGFNLSLLLFVLLLMFVGAGYGVLFSVSLALKNKSHFSRAFKANFKTYKQARLYSILFFILTLLSYFYSDISLFILIAGIGSIAVFGTHLFIFVKSVEESCLLQKLPVSKITEGDWITETIKINGKTIISKNNTGVTNQQLVALKNYRKPIMVKSGIPFVPAFLMAFILIYFIKDYLINFLY